MSASAPQAGSAAPMAPMPSGGRGRGRGGKSAQGSTYQGALGGDALSMVRAPGGVVVPFTEDGLAGPQSFMERQLLALTNEVSKLAQELREVRRENAELRRQLDAYRGVQQHQPYAVSLPPLPLPPVFTPVRPVGPSRTRTAGDLSPAGGDEGLHPGSGADVHMPSLPDGVDSKKARRSLGESLGDAASGAAVALAAPQSL